MQVYNENIRDLLNDTGEFLDLREDPIKVRDYRYLNKANVCHPYPILVDALNESAVVRRYQSQVTVVCELWSNGGNGIFAAVFCS